MHMCIYTHNVSQMCVYVYVYTCVLHGVYTRIYCIISSNVYTWIIEIAPIVEIDLNRAYLYYSFLYTTIFE